MIVERKSLSYALGSVALLAFVATPVALQSAAAQSGAAICQGIEVVSDELTPAAAAMYCKYAVAERKKVEKYWGPTWQEDIRIQVSSSYSAASTLVKDGGQPGNIEMPLDRVKDGRGGLLHEITHNYAPNQNRFLYEGLGVYLQAKIGGNPSYPNFGRKLGVLAGSRLSSVSSLEPLNSVRFPRPLDRIMPERAAYFLAGSFVEYLIERYGLPKFRILYEDGHYEKAYQKSLRVLEQEWRSSL